MRSLLVRSHLALRMLQVDFAKFLGVSDRTMRRWIAGGTRLTPQMLVTLATALHAKDPALAARVAAFHGHTLEELEIGLSPDQLLAAAIVRAAADVAEASPRAMRPALAAALDRARTAGLTMEAAHELLREPLRATKTR